MNASTSTDELSRLYMKFGPVIFSRCRRALRDDALAERATVEIFTDLVDILRAGCTDGEAIVHIERRLGVFAAMP